MFKHVETAPQISMQGAGAWAAPTSWTAERPLWALNLARLGTAALDAVFFCTVLLLLLTWPSDTGGTSSLPALLPTCRPRRPEHPPAHRRIVASWHRGIVASSTSSVHSGDG